MLLVMHWVCQAYIILGGNIAILEAAQENCKNKAFVHRDNVYNLLKN